MLAGFMALCAAMIFHALTQLINQDEEQYVTAAYLAQHLRLYTDFLYLQPPVYPLVLSQLLTLFSGANTFLVARLLSAGLAVGSVVVFYRLARHLAKNGPIAALLAVIFASAPVMLLGYGSTRNDIMPIFFGLGGVSLTVLGLNTKPGQFGSFGALFLAGFVMALAVGTKVTATFIPLTAMIYVFFRARPALLPLTLGGAAGSMPIVYYAATAFDQFLYANATFHLTAPIQFFTDAGQGKLLTWPYQIWRIALAWTREPALVVAALFLAFTTIAGWQRVRPSGIVRELMPADRLFVVVLMATAVPFAFLPNPTGAYYLQPAVSYILLSCAALSSLAQKVMERRAALLFPALAVVVAALQVGRFAGQASQRLTPSQWTVAEVHDLAWLVARHVDGGIVATAYPALILDAGSRIYPEFATGIYFFRSGDHLAPERVRALKGVSPRTLPSMLAQKPPSAVFTGNTEVDRPLLNWARRNCYIELDLTRWRGGPYHDYPWRPRLLVRPPEATSCR